MSDSDSDTGVEKVAQFDVIIVGAGLSGLSAARRILQKDDSINLLVLEAKDRVGGRTLTEPVKVAGGGTEMFDMGGQWVTPPQTYIMEIIHEMGLETFTQYTTGTKYMQVGDTKVRKYTGDIPSMGSLWGLIEFQLFIWRVERMCKRVPIEDPYSSPLATELEGMTVAAMARKYLSSPAGLDSIDAACKASMGTDATRISALFFLAYANAAGGMMKLLLAEKDHAQELRVKGGTQQISQFLAEKVGRDNVRLGEPVARITQTDTDVIVETSAGQKYKCKRLILSNPPNTVSKIEFSPLLPETLRVLHSSMPVGHLTKFNITYTKAFWREAGYSGELVSNGGDAVIDGCECGPLSVTFDATTADGSPALVGFLAGCVGTQWNQKSFDQRRQAVLNGLADIFGDWARTPVEYAEKVWADEPYNGGCPTCFGVPGIMYTFNSLRKPVGRIHWAGTETATHWCGYLSGAVQAGYRAATEVLYKLHVKSVTDEELRETAYGPIQSRPPKTHRHPSHSCIRSLLVPLLAAGAAWLLYYHWANWDKFF